MRGSTRVGRILVVDDDAEVVSLICEQLGGLGFECTGSTSPLDALARLKREDLDLMIVDVEMPAMRGTDLLLRVKGERPELPVILITAFGSIDLAVQSLRAGASDFVTKPFRIEVLQLSIDRTLREHRMRREIVRLRSDLSGDGAGEIVAKSDAMKRILDLAKRAAQSDSTVLLTGESGTGKSALAAYIHSHGPRAAAPFLQINCAALPQSLVESELFGVRKGAFTDAREDRKGLFAASSQGTLFLDEVGELDFGTQAKLLHVLETHRIRPIGGTEDLEVNPRVIAATNRGLEEYLRDGRFRSDFYYRLNVIRIDVPPLRERKEDILPLIDTLLGRVCKRLQRPLPSISSAAMRAMVAHSWPGNVREIANALERAVVLNDYDVITEEDLMLPLTASDSDKVLHDASVRGLSLQEVSEIYSRLVLQAQHGNKAATARVLGIDRRTLYRMLEKDRTLPEEHEASG